MRVCFHSADKEMDLVLSIADHYFFTPYVYPATWPEDDALRQILGLLAVTNLGAAALYLVLGSLSYYFIFDHTLMKHPQFLEVSSKGAAAIGRTQCSVKHCASHT